MKALSLAVFLVVQPPSCGGGDLPQQQDDDLLWVQYSEDYNPEPLYYDFDPPPEIWSTVDGNEPASRENYQRLDVKVDWETPRPTDDKVVP